jgi:hypothetical protein
VPDGAPRKLADTITAGSHAAFMTGLHTTMLVAGFVALAGAALGPLLRPTATPGDRDASDHDRCGHDDDARTPGPEQMRTVESEDAVTR